MSWVLREHGLHNELQAILGYKATPYLKRNNSKTATKNATTIAQDPSECKHIGIAPISDQQVGKDLHL